MGQKHNGNAEGFGYFYPHRKPGAFIGQNVTPMRFRCVLRLRWAQCWMVAAPQQMRARHPLHWRDIGCDSVWNHQPHDFLLNHLFRRRSKKTSKLCVTGLCVGNSPGPVNSPHKGPVTRKMFPFDDVIMPYMGSKYQMGYIQVLRGQKWNAP